MSCTNARASVEPQARQRGIAVTFPRFDLPRNIQADRTRTKQVLINLLSNAIKYNRAHGSVRIDCALEDGSVRVSVSDTGPGIALDKHERMFSPFTAARGSADGWKARYWAGHHPAHRGGHGRAHRV